MASADSICDRGVCARVAIVGRVVIADRGSGWRVRTRCGDRAGGLGSAGSYRGGGAGRSSRDTSAAAAGSGVGTAATGSGRGVFVGARRDDGALAAAVQAGSCSGAQHAHQPADPDAPRKSDVPNAGPAVIEPTPTPMRAGPRFCGRCGRWRQSPRGAGGPRSAGECAAGAQAIIVLVERADGLSRARGAPDRVTRGGVSLWIGSSWACAPRSACCMSAMSSYRSVGAAWSTGPRGAAVGLGGTRTAADGVPRLGHGSGGRGRVLGRRQQSAEWR